MSTVFFNILPRTETRQRIKNLVLYYVKKIIGKLSFLPFYKDWHYDIKWVFYRILPVTSVNITRQKFVLVIVLIRNWHEWYERETARMCWYLTLKTETKRYRATCELLCTKISANCPVFTCWEDEQDIFFNSNQSWPARKGQHCKQTVHAFQLMDQYNFHL